MALAWAIRLRRHADGRPRLVHVRGMTFDDLHLSAPGGKERPGSAGADGDSQDEGDDHFDSIPVQFCAHSSGS